MGLGRHESIASCVSAKVLWLCYFVSPLPVYSTNENVCLRSPTFLQTSKQVYNIMYGKNGGRNQKEIRDFIQQQSDEHLMTQSHPALPTQLSCQVVIIQPSLTSPGWKKHVRRLYWTKWLSNCAFSTCSNPMSSDGEATFVMSLCNSPRCTCLLSVCDEQNLPPQANTKKTPRK